jgi:hypothetical protein
VWHLGRRAGQAEEGLAAKPSDGNETDFAEAGNNRAVALWYLVKYDDATQRESIDRPLNQFMPSLV